MPTSTQVMTANAMRLAADQYNDSTFFVSIMQLNDLVDYHINNPVIANTASPALAHAQTLVFGPTEGIELGDYVYCDGYKTFGVVTSVTQNYSIPSTQFCVCKLNLPSDRILPPQGDVVSTTVTISPGLDTALAIGSPVTFTVGSESTILFPNPVTPSAQGVPG